MRHHRAAGATISLAPWIALAGGPEGRDAVAREARARLADLPLRPYDPAPPEGADGGHALAVTLPGAAPSLPPLVLAARSDRHDPAGLAGLAAALAVPTLLGEAELERDLIVVVGSRREGPTDAARPQSGSTLAEWFEHRRRHDVKAAVVVARLLPARLDGLIHVSGIETDARLPAVLEGAAPSGWRLVFGRQVDDGLPFADHRTPFLQVGTPPRAAPDADPDVVELEHLATHAAQLAATLLRRLDGARLPGPFAGYDSTDVEVAALGAALGARAEDFGGPARGRDELDRVLARLGY